VVILVAMVIMANFSVHQYYYQKSLPTEQVPPTGVTFLGINQENMDHSFINLIKYLLNFGFYKLGLEVSKY